MALPKDAGLFLRLSKAEKITVQTLASFYNTDVSNIIRRLIKTAAGEGALVEPTVSEDISVLCFQIRALSGNLNRLIRAVTVGDGFEDELLIEELKSLYITANALADLYADMVVTAKRKVRKRLKEI